MKSFLQSWRQHKNFRKLQYDSMVLREPEAELKVIRLERISPYNSRVVDMVRNLVQNYLLVQNGRVYYDLQVVHKLLQTHNETLILAVQRLRFVWLTLQHLSAEYDSRHYSLYDSDEEEVFSNDDYLLLQNEELARVRILQRGGLGDKKLADLLLGYADELPQLFETYEELLKMVTYWWQKAYNMETPVV